MNLIVIGGGPAGLMTAIIAAKEGLSVSLFEKNKMLGRKLRITGKGRCNITNACDFDELIANIPGSGRFLYSSFNTFSNHDIIDFFEINKLKTKVERGNRVFPVSDKASDVAETLKKLCAEYNVDVKYGYEVTDIITENGKAVGIRCDEMKFFAENICIATGGLSYPLTGSTGDGYKFAMNTGHTVSDLKPSLVGLKTNEKFVHDLEGLSLRNVQLTLKHCSKEIYKDFGEMLFTSDGISGPIVLSASRYALDFDFKDIIAEIDLKPALSEEKLDKRIQRDFEEYSRKQVQNSLNDLLPKSMIPVIISKWGVCPHKFVNQVTKEERKKLVSLLKHFTITIVGSEGFDRAVVTKGGVNIKEINPKTMESKLVKNLYFVGEVLDVDGYTGGFNLTIAFSTGATAGFAIAKSK